MAKAPAIPEALARLAVNTIKMLAVDGVEKANSGHPGLPMGAADCAFVLWSRYLRYDPTDPKWPDRDRFILSAGHGSMLLYSLLHLAGFELTLADLQQFRQWGSRTPGHPEAGHTPGVEVTTGPLGQGFANGVGMALAAKMAAARFNTKAHALYQPRIFGLVSDGDLMEGISHEAASFAGHLKLGNLVYIYDDNHISIEGETEITLTDDAAKRFDAYGWFTQRIDGHDHAEIERALDAALAQGERPSLIVARTHLANGAPTVHDSPKAHGEPLGKEELARTKQALGWPEAPTFLVPPEVRQLFAGRAAALREEHCAWEGLRDAWESANPDLAKEWRTRLSGKVPETLFEELLARLPVAPAATRALGGELEQLVAERVPALVGGSADLDPSTKTAIKASGFVRTGDFSGRTLHFGVREHGMGGVLNGLAQFGGFLPFGATFLVFSDYMRPSVRLAALGKLRVVYVWTHDSVLLGEDGPTHQPIEQLGALRLILGLDVFRPADALEVAAAWTHAVSRADGPTALILTRQKLPPVAKGPAFDPALARRGGYVVSRPASGPPDLVLMATGSELHVVAQAAEILTRNGRRCQVVSLPCLELFERQDEAYRASVLPPGVRRLSLEAARSEPWLRWVGPEGLALGIERYGASAPDKVIAEKLGLTPESVVERARAWLRVSA